MCKRVVRDGDSVGNGEFGLDGAPRGEVALLALLCVELARLGYCSVSTLGQVCGLPAYVLVFRRPLMSILFHFYLQQADDGARDQPVSSTHFRAHDTP